MITRERFEQLAALAVAGEATGSERAEMDAALATDPALVEEFLELGVTECVLRQAVKTPLPSDPLPLPVLERLEQTRREALTTRLTSDAAGAGEESVIAFRPAEARKRFVPGWLAMAACLVAAACIAAFYLSERRNASRSIAVLAPRGVTGFTQPMLVWEAKPDQRYDVWILPPEGSHTTAPALFTAKNVRPPLTFSDLQPAPALAEESRPASRLEPGTDYRLLVCIATAGRVAGIAVPFRTAPGATKALPPPTFQAAKKLAAENRFADALMLLTQLAPAERQLPETQALEKELRARLPMLSSPASTPIP